MRGRAQTPKQKRAFMQRLTNAWLHGTMANLRFGQFLVCATFDARPGPDMFALEDNDLLAMVERFAGIVPELSVVEGLVDES